MSISILRSRFQSVEDLKQFAHQLENDLYGAASFIEAGETLEEQEEREGWLVGWLSEPVREGIEKWLCVTTEWKEAPYTPAMLTLWALTEIPRGFFP